MFSHSEKERLFTLSSVLDLPAALTYSRDNNQKLSLATTSLRILSHPAVLGCIVPRQLKPPTVKNLSTYAQQLEAHRAQLYRDMFPDAQVGGYIPADQAAAIPKPTKTKRELEANDISPMDHFNIEYAWLKYDVILVCNSPKIGMFQRLEFPGLFWLLNRQNIAINYREFRNLGLDLNDLLRILFHTDGRLTQGDDHAIIRPMSRYQADVYNFLNVVLVRKKVDMKSTYEKLFGIKQAAIITRAGTPPDVPADEPPPKEPPDIEFDIDNDDDEEDDD